MDAAFSYAASAATISPLLPLRHALRVTPCCLFSQGHMLIPRLIRHATSFDCRSPQFYHDTFQIRLLRHADADVITLMMITPRRYALDSAILPLLILL